MGKIKTISKAQNKNGRCIIRLKDSEFIIERRNFEKKGTGTLVDINTYVKISCMDYNYEPSKSLGLY